MTGGLTHRAGGSLWLLYTAPLKPVSIPYAKSAHADPWNIRFRGTPMLDLVFLAAILAAFALFAGLTHGCERL